MTAWGTTWPGEMIRSQRSSMTQRLIWAVIGSVHRPSVTEAMYSPRNLSQGHHLVLPIVNQHFFKGDVPEHGLPLGLRHGNVGSQGGENIYLYATFCQRVVIDVGDKARVGVEACEIRGRIRTFFRLLPARLCSSASEISSGVRPVSSFAVK